MNVIDLLLLLVVLLSALGGFRRGFILSGLALVAWVGSLVLAFIAYGSISNGLIKIIPSLGVWAHPLGFIIALLIFRYLLDYLAGLLLNQIPQRAHTNILNKILGIAPGIVNGLIWALFISVLLLLVPFGSSLSGNARNSRLATVFADKAGWAEQKISPVFNNALGSLGQAGAVKVDPESTVELPFKVENPQRRPDLEAEMLKLVNAERKKQNLPALKADTAIARVAVTHSADMFARGYFSHYTPEGATPFDRMRKGGIRFIAAGENLAIAQTLAIAHKGLMESPGHRADILNAAYGRLGIGILDGGIYGLMITQNFRN